jgi:hypothetical protein
VKLPTDVVIAPDKLRHYLLLPREENDKSQFLAVAGDTSANWQTLDHDLRQLAMTHEVASAEPSPYGTKTRFMGYCVGQTGGHYES